MLTLVKALLPALFRGIPVARILWLLLFGSGSIATAQTFSWARSIGSTGYDQGDAVHTDATGNVYVTGYFQGTVDFDPGPGIANLSSSGAMADVFVAKYDPSGNYLWAFRIGNTGSEYGTGIGVDGSGNVYVTGYFAGTMDMDPGAGTANIAATNDDVFVGKYSSAGVYQWAFKLGGSYWETSHSIAVESTGDFVITGGYGSTVDFNPGAGTTNRTALSFLDMFAAKYNASGTFLWVVTAGSSSGGDYEQGKNVAISASSEVYVVGTYTGTTDFDPSAATVSRTAVSANDAFLVKYNSAGAFQWVVAFGGTSIDDANGVALDAAGNVFITGGFENTVDFDPTAATANLTSAGVFDVFLACYNSAGGYVWANKVGSTANDYAYDITVDACPTVYITGYFRHTVDFDPSASTATISSAGDNDAFIAAYSPSGTYQWAFPLGGINSDLGYDVSANVLGELAATGYYQNTADFDPSPGVTSFTAAAGFDVYLAKYTSICTVLSADVLEFSARWQGNYTDLTWVRAEQGDTVLLEISTDGETFVHLASSGGQSYADRTPGAGMRWYRLNMYSPSGMQLASALRQVYIPADGSLVLSPNPAGDFCTVSAGTTGAFTLTILDMSGHTVWEQLCDNGDNIPVHTFPSGMYFVTTSGNSISATQKLVVSR